MLKVLILGLVLAGQSPGQTPPAPAPAAAAPAPAAPGGEAGGDTGEQAIVCRREPVTGSNRTRRVCERVGVTDYNRDRAQQWRDAVVDRRGTLECETDNACGLGSGPPGAARAD